ncbi:MAG: septum formation initiator family protein [Flavobacteriales bacterium]|nr:septum formation initiator family protein [Flavobacteriales bacterium]
MRKWLTNRYVLISAVLLLWLGFFDQNSLIYQIRLNREIHALENEQSYYRQEIEKLKQQKDAFGSNKDVLEAFAREHYLMKKPEETLFLLSESIDD